MGSMSIGHWLIALVVLLLLFGGGGKIPKLMGDFAKGVKAFKSGLKEGEAAETPSPNPASVTADVKAPDVKDVNANH